MGDLFSKTRTRWAEGTGSHMGVWPIPDSVQEQGPKAAAASALWFGSWTGREWKTTQSWDLGSLMTLPFCKKSNTALTVAIVDVVWRVPLRNLPLH